MYYTNKHFSSTGAVFFNKVFAKDKVGFT